MKAAKMDSDKSCLKTEKVIKMQNETKIKMAPNWWVRWPMLKMDTHVTSTYGQVTTKVNEMRRFDT